MYVQHFQRYNRMGVRSETENEAIVFIHASDAESWAVFLQKKLCSDDYKIQSCFHTPHHDHVPDLFSSAKTCAVLVVPILAGAGPLQFLESLCGPVPPADCDLVTWSE